MNTCLCCINRYECEEEDPRQNHESQSWSKPWWVKVDFPLTGLTGARWGPACTAAGPGCVNTSNIQVSVDSDHVVHTNPPIHLWPSAHHLSFEGPRGAGDTGRRGLHHGQVASPSLPPPPPPPSGEVERVKLFDSFLWGSTFPYESSEAEFVERRQNKTWT